MNRIVPVLLAAGLAVGCQPAAPPSVSGGGASAVTTASSGSSEFTLVTLKVPNMT